METQLAFQTGLLIVISSFVGAITSFFVEDLLKRYKGWTLFFGFVSFFIIFLVLVTIFLSFW